MAFLALTQRPLSEPLDAPKTSQGSMNPPTKWFECYALLSGSVCKHLKGSTARAAPWRGAAGHSDCSLTEPSHLFREKKGIWSDLFCPQNMQAVGIAWLMPRAIGTSVLELLSCWRSNAAWFTPASDKRCAGESLFEKVTVLVLIKPFWCECVKLWGPHSATDA